MQNPKPRNMKYGLLILVIAFTLTGCNGKNEKPVDNRISLGMDTLNLLKLGDTAVIQESTCRGCAYESSTNFSIYDSIGIVKLLDVITTDNNPDNVNGGSIRKDLVLVPVKTGTTSIRVYKFWTAERTAKDSATFATYKIDIKQ